MLRRELAVAGERGQGEGVAEIAGVLQRVAGAALFGVHRAEHAGAIQHAFAVGVHGLGGACDVGEAGQLEQVVLRTGSSPSSAARSANACASSVLSRR